MLIEEVIRTCAVGPVAEAAVASVGPDFAANVERAATAHGMSVGDYARIRVGRFARDGQEVEMRAVALAMAGSPAPVLAALEQILRLDAERRPALSPTDPGAQV